MKTPTTNHRIKISLITLIVFAIYKFLQKSSFADIMYGLDEYIDNILVSYGITYVLVGIPIFIGLLLLHKPAQLLESVGLNKSIFEGLGVGLLSTIPLFIGFSFLFKFESETTVGIVIESAVYAAFFEELYYRAFLFGQLFKYGKLGFLPSIIIGALIFAAGHLYQSQDPMELVMIFLVTFAGALLFAWLYAEWNFNLWVPIGLHFFMNLAWLLFDGTGTAGGNLYANIFRLITILIVITLTIVYKRRNGIDLNVNKKTVLSTF
ncbi:CPBP family intramembrane glutamic endopeptidase [Sediminitomix flava]|uniref:CAAX prenyl protease 2/Lysostaphin resistance protein A-like domain-containing protein n=1 Tax=Sediminitomix flava TaxID=379075 RepID=A0A315Z636_SEDFL|nr:type II CAAX endopeptidase family protein [Sediminitomix flava]PWJ39313.1 hypothetical protein BC781_106214 [Sediminitomix flava]